MSLRDAIEAGDSEWVQHLISQGTDLSLRFEDDLTPLMLAAKVGHKPIVRLLVRAGATVNTENRRGETALMLSAQGNHKPIFDYLWPLTESAQQAQAPLILDAHPTPPEVDDPADTLIAAADAGDLDQVKAALQAGADVNTVSRLIAYRGKTAVYLAARNGFLAVVQALVEAGADVNVVIPSDDIWAGVERTCPRCQTRFRSVQDRGQCRNCKHIFFASQSDYDADTAMDDLWDEAIVEVKPFTSSLTLSPRAIRQHASKPKYIPVWLWHTPLMAAIRRGHPEIARALIQAGAELTLSHHTDQTPLMFAVEHQQREMVKLLITFGVDLDAKNSEGVTALMTAVMSGNRDVVEDCIRAGASVNLGTQLTTRGPLGQTALSTALELGDEAIVDILRAAGASHPGEDAIALVAAAKRGDARQVKDLLDAGVHPDTAEPIQQHLALWEGACYGHEDVVHLLLAAGADVNGGDPGWLGHPLTAATYYGNTEVVRLLIEAGAKALNPSAVSEALDYAKQYHYTEIISLFERANLLSR